MSEPTQEVIERTARTVAEALNRKFFEQRKAKSGFVTEGVVQGFGEHGLCVSYRKFLSDHRTVARYFNHIRETVILQPPPHEYRRESIGVGAVFERLWHRALREPMTAIIALVESVGGEG